jgi:hypothetical protein
MRGSTARYKWYDDELFTLLLLSAYYDEYLKMQADVYKQSRWDEGLTFEKTRSLAFNTEVSSFSPHTHTQAQLISLLHLFALIIFRFLCYF